MDTLPFANTGALPCQILVLFCGDFRVPLPVLTQIPPSRANLLLYTLIRDSLARLTALLGLILHPPLLRVYVKRQR